MRLVADGEAAIERDELRAARLAAERSEQELGRALQRLERAVREPFAVGQRIQDAPVLWLAGAFVVGFVIGRVTMDDRE